MTRQRIILGALVFAVVAAGVWYFWLRGEDAASRTLVLHGNVDIRQVELGFRVGGRLAEMHVEEGDAVAQGALLAVLDKQPFTDDLRLAEAEVAARRAEFQKFKTGSRPEEIAQAEALVAERQAAVDNARRLFERQARLRRSGTASQQAYDDAKARRSEAEARLKSARETLDLARQGFRTEDIAAASATLEIARARRDRAQTALDDTELHSPASGIVLSRIREPGAIVAPAAPVYTVSLSEPVWVRTYVREPDLGRVRPGMKALVTTDTRPDLPYQAHVGFISPVAEFTPRNVETADLRTDLVYRLRVIVDEPDTGLRQGMPVTVTLLTAGTGGHRR